MASIPDELVLDESMFQQLLAAAYILQEQRDRRLSKAVTGPARFLPAPNPPSVTATRLLTDELFWKTATAVAFAAVSVLFVGASIHRFSPLPAGLSLPRQLIQQEVPFEKRTSPQAKVVT